MAVKSGALALIIILVVIIIVVIIASIAAIIVAIKKSNQKNNNLNMPVQPQNNASAQAHNNVTPNQINQGADNG